MSISFLPSPSALSIPDATETVSGKIRIATSAEATTGTNDATSMTPLKVKTVVDAALVGGVQYQGTFDASAPADLSNAEKGDLYIISVAGSYQGKDWAIGDHLLINADMGGTLDPTKIDKVDNTDAVTSVAGRTGAVTLSTADISGLATVASTGAYSDLTGTPALATVATTGAYSDLSGAPTNISSFTNDAGYLTDITGENLGDLADVTISTPSNGQGLVYSSGTWVNGSPSVANLDDIGDVNASSPQDGEILRYSSSTSTWNESPLINYVYAGSTQTIALSSGFSRVNITGSTTTVLTLTISTAVSASSAVFSVLSQGTASYNTLTIGSQSWNFKPGEGGVFQAQGTNTAYLISTVDYDNLANLPTLGTAAALDVGTSANNVVQLDGTAKLPAVDGSQLTNVSASVANLDDIGDVDTTGVADTNVLKYDSASSAWVAGVVNYSEVSGTPTLATVATTGAYSDLSGTPTLATVATTGAYSDLTGTPTLGTAAALDVGTSANSVVQLDGTAKLPAVDGSQLTNVSSSVANIDDIGDVTITSVAGGQALVYDDTSSEWVNVNLRPSVTTIAGVTTLTAPTDDQQSQIIRANGGASSYNLNLPAASADMIGFYYQVKQLGTGTLTIAPNGSDTIDGVASSITVSTQYDARTLYCVAVNTWEIY